MFTRREQHYLVNMAHPAQIRQLAQKQVLLLEKALNAFQHATGLPGRMLVDEPERHGMPADAVIEIEVAGEPRQYLVEIKRVDRFAAIGQIKNQLDRLPRPGLLIANRITVDMADKCRELDVQFMDAYGNAFLRGPNWFVLVKGQRLPANAAMDPGALDAPMGGTPTALRTMFVLLCHPELLNAPYRDIKRAAGVALGAIGTVLLDLNKRGLTTGGRKSGSRRILERERMIDEWVTNYPIKLRPRLQTKRFHAGAPDWWKQLDVTRYEAQWGGEVAAERLTGYLKPSTITLYMHPERMQQNLTRLVVDNKLRAAPDGEIEVLECFWDLGADGRTEVVPPLLVYADLLATMDPRNYNVGQMLREQHLHEPKAQA